MSLYFVTENEDREDFIHDQALQLIMTNWGYTSFAFYGAKGEIWVSTMKKYEAQVFSKHTDQQSPVTLFKDYDSFVDNLFACLHSGRFVPSQNYLVYDDKDLCERVLESLRLMVRKYDERNFGSSV